MYFSRLLCQTLKEDPSEAEVVSHRLMLRGGLIRQVSSGIYSLLPVGLRVLRNVEKIVREEMNRAGALEVYLPAVHPAELWKESGRWTTIGKELLRFKDRNDRDYCFGPTHEEVITDLVRREVRSYRDLPRTLYQIQVKFRDEVRPRFGLMRCREFTMKDAYSFDIDQAGIDESYQKMSQAYHRIFERCELDFRVVEADSGNIGGSLSQEFMVLAPTGEDEVVSCSNCSYGANVEKATGQPAERKLLPSSIRMEKKSTPNKKTVEDVASFLGISAENLIKTLIYKTEETFVAVLIPGDREVNDVKLKSFLGAQHVALATSGEIEKWTGSPIGFSGPVGLKIDANGISRVVADPLIADGHSYVSGANEKDSHYVGVVPGRDFKNFERADIHRVKPGDLCPRCKGVLRSDRGIEVGHIFKLGTKYSEAMNCVFTDKDGKSQPIIMGCYGIGIGRTAAAAIEQNHDANGMIFPAPLAPFDVSIVPVSWENADLRKEAERVYGECLHLGLTPLLDDRLESPGKKFKDADLLGIPLRITIGDKGLSQGKIEVKKRRDPKGDFIDKDSLVDWIKQNTKGEVRK